MKRFLVVLLTLALALSLSGTALASKANDTFIYGIDGDPGNDINTITTSGRYDLTVERLIYSSLLNYYGPDDIEYRLAESSEFSEDGKTLTVNLRKDVTWSDGEPFTADDVVFTYDYIINTSYSNGNESFWFGDEPVKVEKVDDYTVTFTTPIFTPTLLEAITAEHYIMPKHIYEGDEALDNNPKNQTPVGTGPYIWDEYRPGEYLQLKANPNYFLGAPKIGTIILQFVSDSSSALLALRSGQIDAYVVTPAQVPDLDPSAIDVYTYPEGRVGYVSFNLSSSRTGDINLRKAVFYALNRHEINIATYSDEAYFVDAVSFLPYDNAFVTDDLETYAQNLDTAKAYLAKVEDVPTLRIGYSAGNDVLETQALVIQQQLKAVGIDVELAATESTSFYDKLETENDDYDLFLNGYIMGSDPSSYAALYTSAAAWNYPHLADEELDGYFAAGSVEIDPEKRVEIYNDAQRRLADLAVQYSLVTNLRLLAVNSEVGGTDEARFVPIYTFSNYDQLYFK